MNNGPTPQFISIQNRSDFLRAASKGKKFISGTFILQMLNRDAAHPVGTHHVRFGFTVTKRMGNAVTRNRIKRRLRQAARQAAMRHTVNGCDYVIISRHKALDCPFSDLLRDMEFAFSRIPYMKDSQASKPPHTKPRQS